MNTLNTHNFKVLTLFSCLACMSDVISSEEEKGQIKWPSDNKSIQICNALGRAKWGCLEWWKCYNTPDLERCMENHQEKAEGLKVHREQLKWKKNPEATCTCIKLKETLKSDVT